MIKVGIVGGTGYTGVELLRLLAVHPEARVQAITSRSEAGVPVGTMFPSLRDRDDCPSCNSATRPQPDFRVATSFFSPRRMAWRWHRRASWSAPA